MSRAVRPVRNEDSEQIIDLVARCFADYPGCVLDVDGEEPTLRVPADSYDRFWVADLDGRVVGMIACAPHESLHDGPALELKKLYVGHEARGTGLAKTLIQLVESRARELDLGVIDLWSDTRFDRAHAVYERYGWERRREVRDLHDKSNTREYYFVKRL